MSEPVSRNRILSSLIWVYLENIAAQLVSFIVSIVLARLLNPSDYGTIALVSIFINIANVFVTSSFSFSLVQKRDSDELDYNTIFWFNLAMSVIIYVILFLIAPLVANYYDKQIVTVLLRVLALRIPLSAINSIQLAYVSNKMVFKKSFITNSGGAVISGFIGILLAALGVGIWALVAQTITNVIFSTLLMAIVVQWRPRFEFSMERLRRLLGFGWKLLVTGLMFAVYNELRALVIGKRYSADDLGYYDKGYSFPKLIGANIDTTITRVLFPTLSKSQDDSAQLIAATRRASKTSAFIMTPILFGLAIIAEPLVRVLLTEKWLPCVPYLQVMCLVWWLQPTQSCSIQGIKAIGRSDLYLYIELISKCVGVLLIVVTVSLFNSPFAIAVSMLIGQVIAVLIYGAFVSRYIGYTIRQQLFDLLVPGLISAFMCVAIYYLGLFISNSILSMIVQVTVGGCIYIFISELFKIEEYVYLKKMIVSGVKKLKQ